MTRSTTPSLSAEKIIGLIWRNDFFPVSAEPEVVELLKIHFPFIKTSADP